MLHHFLVYFRGKFQNNGNFATLYDHYTSWCSIGEVSIIFNQFTKRTCYEFTRYQHWIFQT